MQVRTGAILTLGPPRVLRTLPPALAAVAVVAALVLLRQPAARSPQQRDILEGQLRAYAGWERAHAHECLVPLGGAPVAGNEPYQRHAEWFLEDAGAAALLRYRTWFQATYAAVHPATDRLDR